MLEEHPHALTDLFLVVDQLTETCETLVCGFGAKIVERTENGLLQDDFELWIEARVLFALNDSQNASDSSH